jgi:uncharacterized hydrophobic protein (TIGR00271 family)
MPAPLAAQDLDTMRASVFFEGPEAARKLSRFWILLVLAAVIAAAGVVGDSTATVIGAMIVAPLMTPIQATMLAVVIGDRANLARSIGLVIAGAASAVAIGYVVGLFVVTDVVAATNSQVASRVSPRLIDLLAALATGVVGSVALARKDISDTLPGVAIAISLVPPLSVVGLTLESGEPHQALGALLLFVTNVVAILATGSVVMAVYGVYRIRSDDTMVRAAPASRAGAIFVIITMVLVVGIPLTLTSVRIAQDAAEQADVRDAGQHWAEGVGWELTGVDIQAGKIIARFEGPTPLPDTGALSRFLSAEGVDPTDVRVELLPRQTIDLGP